jgi:hypothetical protein
MTAEAFVDALKAHILSGDMAPEEWRELADAVGYFIASNAGCLEIERSVEARDGAQAAPAHTPSLNKSAS